MTNEEKAYIHDMAAEPETEAIEEWKVKLLTRTLYQGQEPLPEQPWVLHTKLEPKFMVHMIDPTRRPKEGEDYVCVVCNNIIPPVVMQKFFFLKSICEGKRAGQK